MHHEAFTRASNCVVMLEKSEVPASLDQLLVERRENREWQTRGISTSGNVRGQGEEYLCCTEFAGDLQVLAIIALACFKFTCLESNLIKGLVEK